MSMICIVDYDNQKEYSNIGFIRGIYGANSRSESVKRGSEMRKPSSVAVFQHSKNLL